MSAQAQIIFAIPNECSGLSFGVWLQGSNNTWLLVVEDTNAPVFPEVPRGINVPDSTMWSYRLHAGGLENHPNQSAAVRGICKKVHVLPSFSHVGSGVHKQLQDLGASITGGDNQRECKIIQAIVEGGSKATILKLADEFASFITLETLIGNVPDGMNEAESSLKSALQQCPACGFQLSDDPNTQIADLQGIATWCLQ